MRTAAKKKMSADFLASILRTIALTRDTVVQVNCFVHTKCILETTLHKCNVKATQHIRLSAKLRSMMQGIFLRTHNVDLNPEPRAEGGEGGGGGQQKMCERRPGPPQNSNDLFGSLGGQATQLCGRECTRLASRARVQVPHLKRIWCQSKVARRRNPKRLLLSGPSCA